MKTCFLKNWRFRVRVNSSYSEWFTSTSGVPQGSILGPLLFCMVVDDFSVLNRNFSILKYADDLSIFHFIRDPDDDNSQAEFKNVVEWSNRVRLPINLLKCSVMNFVSKQDFVPQPILSPSGTPFESVTEAKLLAVHFPCYLKWNIYVSKTVSRASQRLFILCNLRGFGCPFIILNSAYFVFVRSLLLHSCPVYANIPHYLKRRILSIENRASKIIGITVSPCFDSAVNKICTSLFIIFIIPLDTSPKV